MSCLLELDPITLPNTLAFSIKAAGLDNSRQTVQVHFDDDHVLEYPWLFLQHNCTCSTCYHASSHSTLRQITELDPDNHIMTVEIVDDGLAIQCTWKDGHEATFTDQWLKERRFTENNRFVRKIVPRDEPIYVGPEDSLDRDSYKTIMTNNERMLQMLETVSRQGVFIVDETPLEVGQLKKLVNKIGFIRLTHYGHEFTVKSEPNPINLAYTSKRLGLHTDLPYMAYPPGIQLLHCIKQFEEGRGGETHLVDGFRVALQMKKVYPEAYKILCETPLEFYDIGTDYTQFFKVHHTPLFVCDPKTGNLIRIAYSSHVLSSYLPVELENVKPLYEALITFMKLCYSPENLMVFKLKEGETLVFDNWRMLHGREGFDPSKGHRHLEGCYIDWDEVNCRIRVLKNILKR